MIDPNNPNHRNNPNNPNKKGTILIWTVLLGVAMTSAFFFLATRMGSMGGITRDSMEYANQKAYLESYADYLESLNDMDLASMGGTINFDGITGTLTNEVDEIMGVLDEGGSETYNFADTINVEWNLCSNNNKESIVIGGTEYPHDTTAPSCSPATSGYDDKQENITVVNPFTISTKGAPVHYRITNATAGGKLPSDTWHLKASINLGYGKKVEVEKAFIPNN